MTALEKMAVARLLLAIRNDQHANAPYRAMGLDELERKRTEMTALREQTSADLERAVAEVTKCLGASE